jgi:hypothetical protein
MNTAKSRTIINLSGACPNKLAGLYEAMGDYAKAEVLYRRSLAICEKALAEHPDTANRLSNLALLKIDLGKADGALEFAVLDGQGDYRLHVRDPVSPNYAVVPEMIALDSTGVRAGGRI